MSCFIVLCFDKYFNSFCNKLAGILNWADFVIFYSFKTYISLVMCGFEMGAMSHDNKFVRKLGATPLSLELAMNNPYKKRKQNEIHESQDRSNKKSKAR